MLGGRLSGVRIWALLGPPRGVAPVTELCLPFPCLAAVIEAYVTFTSLCIYFLKTQNTVTPAFDPIWKAHGHLFS